MFKKFGDKLRKKNLVAYIFTFVDTSYMISGMDLWEERDEATKAGEKRPNNANVRGYARAKDADY